MRVQDIMNTNIRTISSSDSAEKALSTMKMYDIHHLVVKDGADLLGVVSERDLGGRRGAASLKNLIVEDRMTPQVISVKPDTTIRQAANMLRGHAIGCLPVMVDGKLKGIVTTSDLLTLIGRGVEKPGKRNYKNTSRRPKKND